jgi:ubiquinone biosynthesis protein
MVAADVLHFVLWVVLGSLALPVVTVLAGRLLGSRRGWVALIASGIVGWTCAVLIAGDLTDWAWDSLGMVLTALGFGIVLTMTFALALDLVAPIGSLAQGERAGLVVVRNPVSSVRGRLAEARRYRDVLRRAREHGVMTRKIDHQSLPAGVRATLEDAGGMFVKLGQVASTRGDLLPAPWCDELSHLQSRAEPEREEVIRPFLESLIGQPVAEAYAEFDWTPIASASIAQIYRARLHTGDAVVVKVQRPGLDELIEIDAAAVGQLAGLIERRTPLGLTMQPASLADEFISNVREELDFGIEATNIMTLQLALEGREGVRVPKVHLDLSNDRVLTEEFIDAPSIGDVDRLTDAGHGLSEIADRLLAEFFHEIFEDGTFHSDPHPGNILVEPDGTIVLIDLGAVGRLSSGQRESVVSLVLATSNGDAAMIREALMEMSGLDPNADIRALDAAIERMLSQHMRAGGGISTDAFQDLAVVVGRFGLQLPRWFGTLSRTFVCLEGTLRAIDPDFSLVDAARKHAGDGGHPDQGRLSSAREMIEHEAMIQLPRLRRLPQRVDELVGQAAAGRIKVRLSPFGDERSERIVTRLVDRLVLGIVASSVGIGSVLLIGVEDGPTLADAIPLNEALGYAGLATSSVLVLRVIAGIIRDGTT